MSDCPNIIFIVIAESIGHVMKHFVIILVWYYFYVVHKLCDNIFLYCLDTYEEKLWIF
jgi:hypothetical protein